MFRSTAEAEAYINAIPRFTKKNDAAFVRGALERLCGPRNSFDVIHVAGTNGKGSTCAFLSSILTAGGYRTGLFTSPHLVEMRERFRVDGEMIGKRLFTKAANAVLALTHTLAAEGMPHPTFFEFLFLMGMWIFEKEKVGIAVLETGLGGRLDATNVIPQPLAAVITSIGMDHMQYLGDTVAQIASEKAGIIKPGVPVIYNDSDPEAAAVIAARAKETGSKAVPLSSLAIRDAEHGKGSISFSMALPGVNGRIRLTVPFSAPYQIGNAALAVRTAAEIADRYPVSADIIEEAVRSTRWDGRMQEIAPGVFLDGAHNEEGIRAFCTAASALTGDDGCVLLFGVMADKDWQSMVHLLAESLRPRRVILTRPDAGRGMDPEKLAFYFAQAGIRDTECMEDVPSAYKEALLAKGEGILFCAGSLYLIGRILEFHDQL